MRQSLVDLIAIDVTCPSTIDIGDPVVMSDDLTVAAISGAGQFIVGVVCKHEADATKCTIETRFRERRDDRVSGAAAAVGPFVFDAAGKVIAYSSGSHDASAIAGVILEAASGADEVVDTLEY